MRNYIIQRVIWIFIILISSLTITFVLLKSAPEFPPAKTEEKDTWLTRQVQDGYYTVEYYSENPEGIDGVLGTEDDLGTMEEYAAVLNEATEKDAINETVFYISPIGDSTVYKIFTRKPIIQQYFTWLEQVVLHWNWGTSTKIRVNQPAFGLISEKMPLTLQINIFVLLFYIPFGFLFGIISALKKDSFLDNMIQIFIMFFMSLPALVFILLLIILFSYTMDNFLPSLFPLKGIETGWDYAKGFVIPVLAAGLPAIAGFTRMLRAELSEVLTSEFVLLAKTKGLSHQQAVVRHAIRNSLVPMIPIIIGSFAGLLSGSFILESVYAIPGVGRVTLQALNGGNYDYNVLMSSSAFYSVIGLFTVLIVDLSYGIIDPRIRMGAKK
jgi:oligopeptide transport system permease protein